MFHDFPQVSPVFMIFHDVKIQDLQHIPSLHVLSAFFIIFNHVSLFTSIFHDVRCFQYLSSIFILLHDVASYVMTFIIVQHRSSISGSFHHLSCCHEFASYFKIFMIYETCFIMSPIPHAAGCQVRYGRGGFERGLGSGTQTFFGPSVAFAEPKAWKSFILKSPQPESAGQCWWL